MNTLEKRKIQLYPVAQLGFLDPRVKLNDKTSSTLEIRSHFFTTVIKSVFK